MISLGEQLRISSGEKEASADNIQQNLSTIVVSQTPSSQLAISINPRINDYNDRIFKEHQAIKALRQSIEDDKIRKKAVMQSNDSMIQQTALAVKYCDRINSLRDRLIKSNLTIKKYVASLKMKVRVKEQASAKFGGQLKVHLDDMKQKWEACFHEYKSKPQFQQILNLRQSLNELKRAQTLKEQQAKEMKMKLHEIENYKGYGFKSFQEIVIKIALTKLETLNDEKETEVIRNQIETLDRMEVDEPEAEVMPENHVEVILIESVISCDDLITIHTEGNVDITDRASELEDDSNQVDMEDEPAFSSQAAQKSRPNSLTEIHLQAHSTQAIFTPPNTPTVVSHETPASLSVAETQESFTSPIKIQSELSVSQTNSVTPTNESAAIFPVISWPQTSEVSPNPAFTASKMPSPAAFSFVPPAPKTPKGQPTVPSFGLKTPSLKPTTSFNLGLSNTDSTFSFFQTFLNREFPEATAEKSGPQRPSENGSENVRANEESAFLFQPTTPKSQQSTSFIGTQALPGSSDSFSLGSFSSTPQEISKYFANDFLKSQALQSEPFSQSIFGRGNQGTVEENATKKVNQGFSFFNF